LIGLLLVIMVLPGVSMAEVPDQGTEQRLGVVAVDDGGEPDDEAGPPETFYATATVEARPVETATSTVSVMEESEIEALEARHVGDLLPWVPGLLVSGPASRAGLTTARIRGGDPNFTLVLVDGVPLNDSTDPLGGSFNLASLPINGVERVEVVRGPLSTYFGSTGLSGAINVITRGGDEKRLDVDLQAGSSSLIRSSVAYARPSASVDTSLAVSWEQEAGVVGDDRFEQLAVVGGFGIQPSERAQLDLRARISSWEGDDYPDSSGGPVYGSGDSSGAAAIATARLSSP
jgi:outer membrane cobalamin receptor